MVIITHLLSKIKYSNGFYLIKPKISFLLLLLLSIIIFLNNYNQIDTFLPQGFAMIAEVQQEGGFEIASFNYFEGLGLYYIFGSIICSVMNMSPDIFLWIQPGAILTPIFIFTCLYCLSRNSILSAILTAVFFFIEINNNQFYLFPHLPGLYLYYTLLILLICRFKKEAIDSKLLVIGAILLIALNYSSYNSMMRMLLLLGFLLITLCVNYIFTKKVAFPSNKQYIRFTSVLLVIATLIYFTASVWKTILLPYLIKNQSSSVAVTWFDVLSQMILKPLFGESTLFNTNQYSDLLYMVEGSVSGVGVVKYIILSLILLYYLWIINTKCVIIHQRIPIVDCLCIAIICSSITFMIFRLVASSVQPALLAFPAIVVLIRLLTYWYHVTDNIDSNMLTNFAVNVKQSEYRRRLKQTIIVILCISLITTSIIPYTSNYGIDMEDINYGMVTVYKHYQASSEWTEMYIHPVTTNHGIYSDVYTIGIYALYLLLNERFTNNYYTINYDYTTISLSDINSVVNNMRPASNYLIINMVVKYLSAGSHFETARPWIDYVERVSGNEYLNKVYSTDGIIILNSYYM